VSEQGESSRTLPLKLHLPPSDILPPYSITADVEWKRATTEVVTITYQRPAAVAEVAAAAPGQHQLGSSARSLVAVYDYQVPPEGTRRRDLINATVNSKS